MCRSFAEKEIKEIFYTAEQLKEATERIGKQITDDHKNSSNKLLMVCILKGSVCFFADLLREINMPCEIDFMQASSYGSGTNTSGTIKIGLDLKKQDLTGYDVVVVEDILDTGNTLYHTMNVIRHKNPESLKLCALFNKPDRRKIDISVDYEGYVIPDEFIVGYGLDYDEEYRNLPYVGILRPEVYNAE